MLTILTTVGAALAALALSGAAAFAVVQSQATSAPTVGPNAPVAVQYGSR